MSALELIEPSAREKLKRLVARRRAVKAAKEAALARQEAKLAAGRLSLARKRKRAEPDESPAARQERKAAELATLAAGGGVPFLSLPAGRCRKFLADEAGPQGRCCGEPVEGGPGFLAADYCPKHRDLLTTDRPFRLPRFLREPERPTAC